MRILVLLTLIAGMSCAHAVEGNPFSGFKKAPATIPLPDPAIKGGAQTSVRAVDARYMDLGHARRIGNINGSEVWFDEMKQTYVHPTDDDVRYASTVTPSAHEPLSAPDAPGFDPSSLPQIPLPLNRPAGSAGAMSPSKANIPPLTGAPKTK